MSDCVCSPKGDIVHTISMDNTVFIIHCLCHHGISLPHISFLSFCCQRSECQSALLLLSHLQDSGGDCSSWNTLFISHKHALLDLHFMLWTTFFSSNSALSLMFSVPAFIFFNRERGMDTQRKSMTRDSPNPLKIPPYWLSFLI